jgi:hypothetical protein
VAVHRTDQRFPGLFEDGNHPPKQIVHGIRGNRRMMPTGNGRIPGDRAGSLGPSSDSAQLHPARERVLGAHRRIHTPQATSLVGFAVLACRSSTRCSLALPSARSGCYAIPGFSAGVRPRLRRHPRCSDRSALSPSLYGPNATTCRWARQTRWPPWGEGGSRLPVSLRATPERHRA